MEIKTPSLEVLFAPAEFAALDSRDLTQTTCVVFDVLRATTSMVTALANGASAIIPAAQIPESLELQARTPGSLLAGERDGLRIRAELTGGVDFDLGNSPREFTREKVAGKSIVITTTNGTRALRACASAQQVLVSAFVNLEATAHHLRDRKPEQLLLVCGGTFEQMAYEDVLAAGALCDSLWPHYCEGAVADSVLVARELFALVKADLFAALSRSRNGRRLISRAELSEDLRWCARRDVFPLVALLQADGRVMAKRPAVG
jgi:2-phosphosulfolactate phosphatase